MDDACILVLELVREMKWLAGIIIALTLSACDSLSQFLPPLEQFNRRPSQQQNSRAIAQSPATAQMEAQVQQRVNQIRLSHGLSQLRNNEKLTTVARYYSRQMASQNFFSHTSPAGDTMVQRVQKARIFYFVLGENLFKCTNIPKPVPASVQGWMESPGHRENILRPEYRETGIGVWRLGNTYYFTQLFMRSLSLD